MAHEPSRTLRNLLDPVAALAFFAPEAHQASEALGFPPGAPPAAGVRVLDRQAYLMLRSACLGPAPAPVVAAAFGVFAPAVVAGAVQRWRPRVGVEALQSARCDAATAALARLVGPPDDEMAEVARVLRRVTDRLRPEGRALFAGLRSLPYRDEPLFDLWHAADEFREHRGDSHVSSWSVRGLSPVEACLLNDLSQGLPLRSYVRTRGWSDDDLDEAVASLHRRGALSGEGLSDRGRALRDDLERATDAQQAPAVAAVADDLEALIPVLARYRRRIVEGGAYPGRAFVSGVTRWG